MPNQATTLRLGYPGKVKALICLPLAACGLLALQSLRQPGGPPFSWWDLGVLAGLALCAVPVAYVWRQRTVIEPGGVAQTSLWGTKQFRREDFLAYERIALEPGEMPDLLLRFKSGVVFLGSSQIDCQAQQVIDYLRAAWQVDPAAYQAPRLGAVDPVQTFEYESLHVGVIFAVGVLSTLMAIGFPVFGMVAVIGAFCFRAAWRAMGRAETDEEGITFTHRFAGTQRLAWNEVESVAYWSSFAQGGVRIKGAGKTIRLYRWIGGYPMLNRLLHDKLDAKAFWPTLQLPMRVDLNRRRRLGVLLPYILLMSNALLILWEGNMLTFAMISLLPTFVAAAMIWGSSRELEIDKDEVRDTWRYLSFRKVNHFRRAELTEARLGRQLSVGGLWMKFGDTRLEIASSDTGISPEQILTCLRREWAWEDKQQQPSDNAGGGQPLRGAA